MSLERLGRLIARFSDSGARRISDRRFDARPAYCRRYRHAYYGFDKLEKTALLATVTGLGETLSGSLAANENMAVVSDEMTYTFCKMNISNGGVASTENFSTFSSTALTLQASGLTRYCTVGIVDCGPMTSVTLNDSGAAAYSDVFSVVLDQNRSDSAARPISPDPTHFTSKQGRPQCTKSVKAFESTNHDCLLKWSG